MAERIIFIVDDEPNIARVLEMRATKWGYDAQIFPTGESCLDHLEDSPDVVVLDVMLPGISGVDVLKEIKKRRPELPVIMLSAQASIETAIDTLRFGATDYFSKPVDFQKLEVAVKNAQQMHDLEREVQRLRENVEKRAHFDNIVAGHGEMMEVFKLIEKVKDSDICVLVLGESGTGKELVAKAIHYNSKRKAGPFVVVNCASIPRDLLESELFGHEKGSFTGAFQRRMGKFEQANGGTIFLDEIGELDQSLQAKLLRVIQTKQFDRVGGNETITSDVRIVSATNRDLREDVTQKRFREDLYFRLATFPIMLPPLRDRRSDILLLAEHFLKQYSQELSKPGLRFTRKALKLLYEYPWPGNVRELENVIQRALVMAEGKEISERELPSTLQSFAPQAAGSQSASLFDSADPVVPLERIREAAVRHALKATGGNIVEAASKLKIGRATLYRLMKKYKLSS